MSTLDTPHYRQALILLDEYPQTTPYPAKIPIQIVYKSMT